MMSSSGISTPAQAVDESPESHDAAPPVELLLEQVERILCSRTMSTSDVLRKLLRFLAQKTASGEADDLKEYTVATDGLGKPSSYDPRQTSAVRIQAGRLRLKLQEYHRDEAPTDPLIIDLPKGHYRLTYRWADAEAPLSDRQTGVAPVLPPEELSELGASPKTSQRRFEVDWKLVSACVTALALIFFGTTLYLLHQPVHSFAVFGTGRQGTDHDFAIKQLWQPFLDSKRPLLLVAEDPLFVEFKAGESVYVHDPTLASWDDAAKSSNVVALRRIFNNAEVQPSHQYTSFAEARATFLIGRLFGERNESLFSLVKASEVSHEQIADDNLLLIGISPDAFADKLRSLSSQVDLVPAKRGVQVLDPHTGELPLYEDAFLTSKEQGSVYALVSHIPGPLHETDIESFVSSRSSGYVAAVRAFSDESLARDIVTKLKQASGGSVPRYFQVLLKVTFKDSLPIETVCVVARPLN